ncbi:MAG: hypothetical protein KJ062_10260 [Thermoanaerobaculia bacterium]|nr:hypothetical protein [Thermoanaerobaculia bacterium]
MNGKQGAEATIASYPNRVVVSVRILSGDVGGAASLKLFEVTPGGNIEVSRKGSDHGHEDLDVPRLGSYFAEITDARGKKYRTQTVSVEQGFFDLAEQRGVEERASLADRARRQQTAQRTPISAPAPRGRVEVPLSDRIGWASVGALLVVLAIVFVAFVRRFF